MKEMKEEQLKGKKQLVELTEAMILFQTSLMSTRKTKKKRKTFGRLLN